MDASRKKEKYAELDSRYLFEPLAELLSEQPVEGD